MASRFEIATGKIPENKKITEQPRPKSNKSYGLDPRITPRRIGLEGPLNRAHNFTSHLKLVNDLTGEEVNLGQTANFNLSIADSIPEPEATVSLSFSCPINVAYRLFR